MSSDSPSQSSSFLSRWLSTFSPLTQKVLRIVFLIVTTALVVLLIFGLWKWAMALFGFGSAPLLKSMSNQMREEQQRRVEDAKSDSILQKDLQQLDSAQTAQAAAHQQDLEQVREKARRRISQIQRESQKTQNKIGELDDDARNRLMDGLADEFHRNREKPD